MSNKEQLDSTEAVNQALYQAVYRLLSPLTDLLLKQGVPFNAFTDIARQNYVDVATRNFALPERRQTVSRVSVLTGINRKDVKSIQESGKSKEGIQPRFNRASRVVNGWLTDKRYLNTDGDPKPLPLEGELLCFAELVKHYGGDVHTRALLDELIHTNSVDIDSGGTVTLNSKCYVPKRNVEEKLRISGNAANDLLSTLAHNIDKGDESPRYQRSVAYANIPLEFLDEIRARSEEELQELLTQVNGWLSQYDRDVNPKNKGSEKVRAGIGMYYFEETPKVEK